MKYILSILITLFAVQAIAQPSITYTGNTNQLSVNRGSTSTVRLQYIPRGFYPFPTFDTLGTIWVDSAMTRGLFYHNGTVRLRLASVPYVDSVAASIEAGSVDSSIYSTVTRLADSLHNLRDYVDSNNTIIYGSISALYDTLPNYVTYNNATQDINLNNKNISNVSKYNNIRLISTDSSTIYVNNGATFTVSDDAVISGTNTGDQDLSGLVPYTGATTNVNLGSKSLTTNKVLADTLGAKSSMGIHLHGTGGTGIMVGAGGGGNITFDDYPTTVVGDSVLSTNSSGGVLRYNMKGKLANYLLRSDTSTISNRINLKLNITDTANIRLRAVAGTNMTITGTYPNLTFNATGGGGGSPTTATNTQVLYKSGTDTLKGANVVIDSTDGRLVLVNNLDTSAVLSFSGGGTKIAGSNTFGTIRIMDTASLRAEMQRAVNVVAISQVLAFNVINFTNKLTISGQIPQILGTQGTVYGDYNATIQHLNYGKVTLTTTAAANQNAGLRFPTTAGAIGIITGNTKFSGGGGKGTFMFSLPAYNSGHRLIVGYSRVTTALSGDPTTFMETLSPRVPLIGIGKDAADATLHWMFRNSEIASSVTKVDIGVTPNSDDMYIVTIYVSPSSNYILKLEVMSKTGTSTHIYQPTTNTPPVGTKLIPFFQSNSGLGSVATVLGVIQFTEEIY